MSEINKPKAEIPEKDFSTDTLETVFDATDQIILEIKTACALAMRSIHAIGNNSKFRTHFFRNDLKLRYGQLANLNSQLNQETIKRKTIKRELQRKIELLTEAINLYKNAFLARDLERAKKMLQRSLDGL